MVSLENIMDAMRISPLIWPLLVINVLALTGCGILLAYHLAYVVPRMTSTQDLIKRDPNPDKWVKYHPGDRLSIWRNLEQILLHYRVPSSLMGNMRMPVVFQDFKNANKEHNAQYYVRHLTCDLDLR
jgi:hypothetical protein